MIKISDIKAAAQAATPGPWKAGGKSVSAAETEDRLGMDVRLYGGSSDDNRRNARHIAACSPKVVLALCEAVEAAQAYMESDSQANWVEFAAMSKALEPFAEQK